VKPIYLFADSQLLFWKNEDELFLDSVRNLIDSPQPKAAYIGASNGDQLDYYELFQGAMEGVGIRDCCMIHSHLSATEAAFLDDADLILLAGGDVQRGWQTFTQNGVRETITRRFLEGAILIGISAGSVQLGWYGWPADDLIGNQLFDTFKLVPFVVDAHDENNAWRNLDRSVRYCGGLVNGIGLPAGGGIIYHTNHTVESIRYPAVELFLKSGEIVQNLLFPPGIEASAHIIVDHWLT
jgi:cyanophycinase